MSRPEDIQFMRMALGLGARGLGDVAPNPAVGCVIVSHSSGHARVVGRGWTQATGRPHAETEALRRAGGAAHGATAYVSLEPCAHNGKTPPCADALAEAGIARVVGACKDPDPRTSGQGFARLRAAGIEVMEGVLAAEAEHLNAGFIKRVTTGLPLVTLKIASSIDGRSATQSGASQWITGPAARSRGHLMRAASDAIMIGSATAIVDDPDLSCRLSGLSQRSPVRIVADGRLRLPLTAKLVRSARDIRVWLVTLPNGDKERRRAFEDCGVEIIQIEPAADGAIDMAVALREFGTRGITRLMVEGGARIASALMRARLVDRIEWFQSPKIIGGDGYPAMASLGVSALAEAPMLERIGMLSLGEDNLLSYLVRK